MVVNAIQTFQNVYLAIFCRKYDREELLKEKERLLWIKYLCSYYIYVGIEKVLWCLMGISTVIALIFAIGENEQGGPTEFVYLSFPIMAIPYLIYRYAIPITKSFQREMLLSLERLEARARL